MMTREEIVTELSKLADEVITYGTVHQKFKIYGLIISIGPEEDVDPAPFYVKPLYATDYGYVFYKYLQYVVWRNIEQLHAGHIRLEKMINVIKTVPLNEILLAIKTELKFIDIDRIQAKIDADPLKYINCTQLKEAEPYYREFLLLAWVRLYAKTRI